MRATRWRPRSTSPAAIHSPPRVLARMAWADGSIASVRVDPVALEPEDRGPLGARAPRRRRHPPRSTCWSRRRGPTAPAAASDARSARCAASMPRDGSVQGDRPHDSACDREPVGIPERDLPRDRAAGGVDPRDPLRRHDRPVGPDRAGAHGQRPARGGREAGHHAVGARVDPRQPAVVPFVPLPGAHPEARRARGDVRDVPGSRILATTRACADRSAPPRSARSRPPTARRRRARRRPGSRRDGRPRPPAARRSARARAASARRSRPRRAGPRTRRRRRAPAASAQAGARRRAPPVRGVRADDLAAELGDEVAHERPPPAAQRGQPARDALAHRGLGGLQRLGELRIAALLDDVRGDAPRAGRAAARRASRRRRRRPAAGSSRRPPRSAAGAPWRALAASGARPRRAAGSRPAAARRSRRARRAPARRWPRSAPARRSPRRTSRR